MLQAVSDNVATVMPGARLIALSTYPEQDRREHPDTDVEILSLKPHELLFPTLPLALLIAAARKLGLEGRALAWTAPLRALMDAAAVADLAGISFADGRGIPTLAYNILMTGIPLLVGAPVVKCAQAMGTFKSPLNRMAARVVLSNVTEIVARGPTTLANLEDLGIRGAAQGADLAFLMATPESADLEAEEICSGLANKPFVAVSPSSVLRRLCERDDIDYVDLMSRTCDQLVRDLDLDVLVLAHSARSGRSEGRMNDLPVCRDIAATVRNKDRVIVVDRSVAPATLRAIIGRSEVLLTSRFHAMISALATCTPMVVLGWSHKYEEVLDSFGLGEWVMGHQGVSASVLADRTVSAMRQRQEISDQIAGHLVNARLEAGVSLDALARVASYSAGFGIPVSSRPEDLSEVIESGMCIACGACAHADPSIELELDDEKQIFQPTHAGNALAAAVCPAVEVDYAGLEARRFPFAESSPFGVIQSVMLAQSMDEPRNRNASSGGVLKEVLRALLQRPEVDGVISISHGAGLDFPPRIITTVEEVDTLPGSIYHNLPKDQVLEILKSREGLFVLVGIPCELEGIFQYIYRCAPELESRIHTTIGLICGWQYSHHAIRAICEFKGIDFDGIERISYRGGGPVGKLRIVSRSQEFQVSRRVDFAYQVAFDRSFNTSRCHVCVNHSNYLADLVVGDAWLPSTVATRTGISLVINRTREAEDLMQGLSNRGEVAVVDVSTEEIKESQKPPIVFGDFAYSYAAFRRRKGLHTPLLDGPNRTLARRMPDAEVQAFHVELEKKLSLQRGRRYRRLYWRKATIELPNLTRRYWQWFSVRILRRKSWTGERKELSHKRLSVFR
jgi:coenzyme F420-reducing hydrogenase beta subunit/polysaccharide pyruvyl transferase WcaK-like protein